MARIEAELNIDRGRAIVALGGGLDVSNAHRLGALLRNLVREGCSDVVVDLADVSRLDASGVGILRGAANALRRASGGTLRYRNARDHVAEVLVANGLEEEHDEPMSTDGAQPTVTAMTTTATTTTSRDRRESTLPSLRRPERTTRSRVPRQ